MDSVGTDVIKHLCNYLIVEYTSNSIQMYIKQYMHTKLMVLLLYNLQHILYRY